MTTPAQHLTEAGQRIRSAQAAQRQAARDLADQIARGRGQEPRSGVNAAPAAGQEAPAGQ